VSQAELRDLLTPLRRAQYNFEEQAVRKELQLLLTGDALVQFCCPLDTVTGPETFYEAAYRDLLLALPDLERRDTIVMAGPTPAGDDWIGCCGYYTGTFRRPWLDIPPTGHMASLRFHEFYRVVDGRVTEVQSIWDIPELMMQAGSWPMAPSLGREWHVPGPASEDGLLRPKRDPVASQEAFDIVFDMCEHLGKYAEEGVDGMRLGDFWHPRCSWYGPSGIGSCRGVEGFRNWHQIPFLNGMPDRVGNPGAGHMFADNGYVGFTAWPGMYMTISEDGWLGIPPVDREITMRSLDFWRVEAGSIRENWVLVDILDVYRQIGVDVLRRVREFNKARGLSPMAR
jgi:predicted ester cyclase